MNGQQINTGLRLAARLLLGAILVFAGVSHLTFARTDFHAQVPPWVPLDPDLVVVLSGIVEICLGSALILLHRHRVYVGWLAAAFFIAIFPGNIAQWAYHRNAFSLNTDHARTVRLFFQPLPVIWSLWSTGAWAAFRKKRLGKGNTLQS